MRTSNCRQIAWQIGCARSSTTTFVVKHGCKIWSALQPSNVVIRPITFSFGDGATVIPLSLTDIGSLERQLIKCCGRSLRHYSEPAGQAFQHPLAARQ